MDFIVLLQCVLWVGVLLVGGTWPYKKDFKRLGIVFVTTCGAGTVSTGYFLLRAYVSDLDKADLHHEAAVRAIQQEESL